MAHGTNLEFYVKDKLQGFFGMVWIPAHKAGGI